MKTEEYLNKLKSGASIKFSDFIELIDSEYNFSNIAFENGEIINSKSENQGSAKVFCFGHMHSLSEVESASLLCRALPIRKGKSRG